MKVDSATFRSTGLVAAALGLAMILQAAPAGAAGDQEVNTGYFGNVAIKGYDPVAYFTESAAVPGVEEYSLKWLGAYWRFASAEHKRLFSEAPQRYAPQYGGHCATGMAISGGRTKDIDPEAWVILDGKLYLNYSRETNTLITEGVVSLEDADVNWENGPPATH